MSELDPQPTPPTPPPANHAINQTKTALGTLYARGKAIVDWIKTHLDKPHIQPYQPLITVITAITLATMALELVAYEPSMFTFMHTFMGLFFVVFALFKLLDLDGFVKGFKKYDIFARSSTHYAKAYPYIEFFLGLAYLSFFVPPLTYALTMIVMTMSAFSVVRALINGMDVRCACLGNILNVPLSTVSIIENVGMGVMALLMLLTYDFTGG